MSDVVLRARNSLVACGDRKGEPLSLLTRYTDDHSVIVGSNVHHATIVAGLPFPSRTLDQRHDRTAAASHAICGMFVCPHRRSRGETARYVSYSSPSQGSWYAMKS